MFRSRLLTDDRFDETRLAQLEQGIATEIDEAVEFALNDSHPAADSASLYLHA
jgi:hypothetical protein